MRIRNFKWLAIALIFICCTEPQTIVEVFALPEKLKETSAVEITEKSNRIWTLEDHGNKPELYALDAMGNISHTLKIEGVSNIDWEELASDANGNLYIGDFGNNDNDRKDLAVYMISVKDLDKTAAAVAKKITFYYPEQTEFPPKKSDRVYDAEAFFYFKENLYIFTKNRSGDSGDAKVYKIPTTEGFHKAQLIGTFTTCDGFRKCAITGADISDDGKKIALLSNRKVWIVENFKKDDFLKGKVREIDLGNESQLEGVCFKGNEKLYLVDERDKHTGGKLYELKL
jgi:hypothetical protein